MAETIADAPMADAPIVDAPIAGAPIGDAPTGDTPNLLVCCETIPLSGTGSESRTMYDNLCDLWEKHPC